jgi:hypothetical protein
MPENAQPAGVAVSFARDIVPLFRPMDIQCMKGRNVFLIDYQFMSTPDNAAMVKSYLTGDSTPRMPYGGPYWSDDSIQLLQSWIDGGYKP